MDNGGLQGKYLIYSPSLEFSRVGKVMKYKFQTVKTIIDVAELSSQI